MQAGFEDRLEKAVKSVERFLNKCETRPYVGMILGSGLGDFIRKIDGPEIPYSSIQGFPVPTVEGHHGLLKIGQGAAVFAGRFHAYEGWRADDIVLPIFLMARMGIEQIIITNAAGAVNRSYKPGQLVLIKDHLNLMGFNPLVGSVPAGLGPRFPDLSKPYHEMLRALARRFGGKEMREGVYAALSGPSYETPAEVRMLRKLGADMVGMSTVPEVIAANFLDLNVLGISCITNMAAGILDQPLNHEEVIETGRKAASSLADLLLNLLGSLSASGIVI